MGALHYIVNACCCCGVQTLENRLRHALMEFLPSGLTKACIETAVVSRVVVWCRSTVKSPGEH